METTKSTIEDKALEQFTDVMIEHLEGLKQNWKKPWFCNQALVWPCNLDGKNYNGGNAFILAMLCAHHGYKLPIFVTSKQLDAFNGKKDAKTKKFVKATDKDGNPLPLVHVNKGEKSFPVMFYTPYYKDKDGKIVPYDVVQNMTKEEIDKLEKRMTNKIWYVFNIEQTNLKETRPEKYDKIVKSIVPNYDEKKEEELTTDGMFEMPAMDAIISANKWVCPIKQVFGDDAYYSISQDCIVIPEKKQFTDGEAFYGSLWHEMAHSTGAEKRLNRLKPSTFGSPEYAREELVAELSAALVGMKYGVQKHLKEDSVAYLQNWLGSLKQSPQFIKTVMSEVKKAASMVSEHIDIMQTALDNGERFDTIVDVTIPDVSVEDVAAKSI